MTRSVIPALTLTAVVAAAPLTARAGGYIISEMDSRAAGRGNAAAALEGPSAVFFNPANIVNLKGVHATAGISLLLPRFRFDHPDPGQENARTVAEPSLPPNLSVTYHLGDMGFGDLAAGLGVYVPYGASLRWPRTWAGREQVQEISLRAVEISPVIALRPSPMFAVGVGLRVLPSEVYLRRAVRFGSELEGDVEMAGTGTDFAASAGITIWGFENLSLALTWRSEAILRFRGQSDFEFPPPFDTEARDRPVRARLPLPQVFRLGANYDIIPDELSVSADIEFQQWSAFRKLRIAFENGDGTDEIVAEDRNAQDSITFHIGGEYKIMDGLYVRAGYVYDEKTLPEETVNPAPPDSDRHVVSVGASYVWDGWLGFHAHYGQAFFTPRVSASSPFPGRWEGGWGGATVAFIAGIGVSASFDLAPVFAEPLFGEPAEEGLVPMVEPVEEAAPADAAEPPAGEIRVPVEAPEGGEAVPGEAVPAEDMPAEPLEPGTEPAAEPAAPAESEGDVGAPPAEGAEPPAEPEAPATGDAPSPTTPENP